LPDYAAVFLDGGYLDKGLEGFGFPTIDYQAFSDAICKQSGDFIRFRTYYYHAPPFQSGSPTPEERTRYANKMRFFNRFSTTRGSKPK